MSSETHLLRMVVSALLSRLSKFAIQSCHEFEVKKVKEKERARRKEVNQVILQRLCCIYGGFLLLVHTSICFDRPNAFMLYRFRVMFRTEMCFCDHFRTSGIYIKIIFCVFRKLSCQLAGGGESRGGEGGSSQPTLGNRNKT